MKRYERDLAAITAAEDRLEAIRTAADESVIKALAAAARAGEPLLANVLADEAMNRMRRVRNAAHALPEGLLVLDAGARITHINEGALRLFGVTREEAIGRLPMALIDRLHADGSVVPRTAWTASQAIAQGKVLQDEAWFRRHSDGALFSAAFVLTPLVHHGVVVGAVGLFHDTTLEKSADRDADAELRALATVARHTPDALLRTDVDGRIFWASPSSLAVLGYAPADLVGLALRELVHEEDAAHAEESLAMSREPKMPPVEAIFRARRKDASVVWIHARVQGVDGPAGAVAELVASLRPLHPRSTQRS